MAQWGPPPPVAVTPVPHPTHHGGSLAICQVGALVSLSGWGQDYRRECFPKRLAQGPGHSQHLALAGSLRSFPPTPESHRLEVQNLPTW